MARYRAEANVFKALGNPTRLAIAYELAHGERCVHELARALGTAVPNISRHLAVLKSAHIVEDEKRGNKVFYRIKIPCLEEFFQCVRSVLQLSAREHLDIIE